MAEILKKGGVNISYMLKNVFLDLRICRIIDNRRHIKFLQREVNKDAFTVDFSLGKSDNRFMI